MSTLAERMKKALLVSGISQQELAKACGVTHSSVSFWVSGKTKALKAESANKAAACLGVSPRWLAEGIGEMKTNTEAYDDEDFSEEDEAFVSIPVYEVRLSAGHCGMPTYDELTEYSPVKYPRAFFQTRKLNPAACKGFIVSGDSMEPVLWDRDTLLVDCSYQVVQASRVYAFFLDGYMRVKRLFPRSNGDILIRSDNPDKGAYPDELLPSDQRPDRFRMIGRVVDRRGDSCL